MRYLQEWIIRTVSYFFTLSSAGKLLDENFTTLLEEKKLKMSMNLMNLEERKQTCDEGESWIIWISPKQYLEKEMDQSVHEILRSVIVTRNYNHLVKAFIKEIITNLSNPMSVEHFSKVRIWVKSRRLWSW